MLEVIQYLLLWLQRLHVKIVLHPLMQADAIVILTFALHMVVAAGRHDSRSPIP